MSESSKSYAIPEFPMAVGDRISYLIELGSYLLEAQQEAEKVDPESPMRKTLGIPNGAVGVQMDALKLLSIVDAIRHNSTVLSKWLRRVVEPAAEAAGRELHMVMVVAIDGTVKFQIFAVSGQTVIKLLTDPELALDLIWVNNDWKQIPVFVPPEHVARLTELVKKELELGESNVR